MRISDNPFGVRRSIGDRPNVARRSIGERPHVSRKSIGERPDRPRSLVQRRSRDEIWPTFVVGLDLGQSHDYSALVVAQRVLREAAATGFDGCVGSEFHYHIRDAHHFRLGTEYPAIAEAVADLLNHPKLAGRTALVVDATGVGAAVVGLLWRHGLRPVSIQIAGGDQVSRIRWGWRVPKRDLVSVLQVLFQTRRIKIASEIEWGEELFEELLNFTARINPRLTQTFSPLRNDQHDDLVIALSLGCHYLERLCYRPGIVRIRMIGGMGR